MVEQEFQSRTFWCQSVLFPWCSTASSRRGMAVLAQCLLWTCGRWGSENVQRIAVINVLTVYQELASCVLPLCLVLFWVIHVAAGKVEFTAVKRWPHLPGHTSVLPFSSSVTLGNFFFLYTSVSLSVKWDSIHISTMLGYVQFVSS